jgi:subtilisin family serine protease
MQAEQLMRLPVIVVLAAAACAPAAVPGTSLATAPSGMATRRLAEPPTPAYDVPPSDWQLLDPIADGVQGTGARRAVTELLAGRTPTRTVLVAVIDGGTDTAHAALRDRLWRNPKETVDGKDDDGDGLVDDTFGWNYLGGPDGRNVKEETAELTRESARCMTPARQDAPECPAIIERFEARRRQSEAERQQLRQVSMAYEASTAVLHRAMPGESLTVATVTALVPASDTVGQAREFFLQLAANGVTPAALAQAIEAADNTARYGLNPSFNPRTVVGDDPLDMRQRAYGNHDVTGPDASHGTHVAGIIGAMAGPEGGVGVASTVRLMVVRVVPNGDERDKDVANGIRYAVDHGAQIINMSFGKGLSPQKAAVDEAVRYADAKGVLLIHAAGNDGHDLAVDRNYPVATYLDGTHAANWIEVGASAWRGGGRLAADFSNYGKDQVDVFAPGTDILSTVPGGGWERKSGTSMATPVVSGVAALLMSYFPKLSAADVKRLLLESSAKYPEQLVARPGSGAGTPPVRFGDLSRTAGVVDAFAAVAAALAMEQAR